MGGRKSFSPGDILQAADVQDFLMDQTVMVFGGTAARGSGIASPTEGMISYRTDADALEVYTGTAWVPAAQAAGAATVTNRNLLYNGAMQVSQRGTSTTGITSGATYHTADRFITFIGTAGTWTQDIQTDAPSGSGLRRSVRMLCTTGYGSPAAGTEVGFTQRLEGQDLQRIAKGTASAKKLTLSFWVKSNTTGTYVVELRDEDNTRHICATYSISASATWEKKTITFAADTTGALDNDNAMSLNLIWWLAAGSTFTSGTLATTWAATSNANRAVGQTNLAAATNNYWQVTGVQLEVGDVATDFEFKSYGQELAECQRYYYRVGTVARMGAAITSAIILIPTPHPTVMRTTPVIVQPSSLTDSIDLPGVSIKTPTLLEMYGSGQANGSILKFSGMTGLTVGAPAVYQGADIGLSAEL